MTTLEGGITFDPTVRPLSGGGVGRPYTIPFDDTYTFSWVTAVGGFSEARALLVIAGKQARLGELTDGWRGPDSLAPSPTARAFFDATIRKLMNLSPRFLLDAEPAPTSDGGIQLEWDRDTVGYSAEITADVQLVLNVFPDDPAHDAEHIIEQPNPLQLAEFIAFGTHAGTHPVGF